MAEERTEDDKKVRPLMPAIPKRIDVNYMKGQTLRCLARAVVIKKKAALRMYYAAGGIVTYLSLYNTVNCGLSLLLECGEYLTVLFSFENAPTMLQWTDEMTTLADQCQTSKMTVCKDDKGQDSKLEEQVPSIVKTLIQDLPFRHRQRSR